ncbi:MAG TPA: hypothetical protein VFR56_03695, partial [Actinomycetes bacterium]|nr:hypothetical protein [Actinomycetes bacterium]
MAIDPTRNVVAFKIEIEDGDTAVLTADAPTTAPDGVRQAWASLASLGTLQPSDIKSLFVDWEPTEADAEFLAATFPHAEVSHNFVRPRDGRWDVAFESARQQMEQLLDQDDAQQTDEADGELLPVLWSPTDMLQVLPHWTVVPDHLYLALAWVAPTPRGTIGMNHTTHHTLTELPDLTPEDLLEIAMDNIRSGLQIDVEESEIGRLLTLHRSGSLAAGAVALDDFHQRMSEIVESDRLLIGLPCQDHVLVAAA